MPKARVTTERIITISLDLTEHETKVLMGMMQNPIGTDDPEDEDTVARTVRSSIFVALHKELYGSTLPYGAPLIDNLGDVVLLTRK